VSEISWTLQAKLGSLCVHVDEALSAKGHAFDAEAARALLSDPEVVAWLEGLGARALLPVKR
jgi:hypothetical protein